MNSFSIQLNDDAYRRLDDLTNEMGLTKDECIQEIILMYHEEIIEEIEIIKERLAKPARRWKHSDIENGVDLAG